jgi:signal transduction histidine kinase
VTTARERELLEGLRIRDAFLVRLAKKLEERVAAAAKSKIDRKRALLGLVEFAAELRIIAEPRRPIRLRRRRIELTSMLLRTFEPKELPRGIKIDAERGDGRVSGQWDEAHLRCIVAELVSNAAKYGAGRPLTIRAAVRGQRVELSVANAGSWRGPSARVERFRRSERRPNVEGYGIGLWLSRRLARAHGGRLRFATRNRETRAILCLPFDSAKGDLSGFCIRFQRLSRRRWLG